MFSLTFSHVGLFVNDQEKMVDFYSNKLGFCITDRGDYNGAQLVFMSRDARDHHQVVLASGRPDGLPNLQLNQLSFRLPSLGDLQRFYRYIKRQGVSDLAPGFHGNAWSVYFRDPEGNRIEVFTDTDWYVAQPIRLDFDLDRPEGEIRHDCEQLVKSMPSYVPIEQWRADTTRRIAEHVARFGETAG